MKNRCFSFKINILNKKKAIKSNQEAKKDENLT